MSMNVTFFGRIKQVLDIAFERAARERMRRYLLGQSDRALEDVGFSRELLEQGQKAWPWRTTYEPLGAIRLPASRQALYTFSNTEPADQGRNLDVAKPAIRFTRPIIDREWAA